VTVGAWQRPTLRYIGNVRDLLAMICDVGEDGWVLEFGCGRWRVRIAPMADGKAPYKVGVYSPAAIETFCLRGAASVGRAVESAVGSLRAAGVADEDVQEQRMLEIARGIDSGP
jgi:hypothetical protein